MNDTRQNAPAEPSPLAVLFLRLYGPRLIPFLRSLRTPSTQVSARPYLTHRSHGRASSHRLHAPAQFVHCELGSAHYSSIGRSFCKCPRMTNWSINPVGLSCPRTKPCSRRYHVTRCTGAKTEYERYRHDDHTCHAKSWPSHPMQGPESVPPVGVCMGMTQREKARATVAHGVDSGGMHDEDKLTHRHLDLLALLLGRRLRGRNARRVGVS